MRGIGIVAALILGLAGPGRTDPVAPAGPSGPPPIEAFGHLPSVDLIAVSPDGSKFAVAVGNAAGRQVQIRNTSDREVIRVLGTGKAKIRSLQWAGENHLLVSWSATADVIGLSGPRREYWMAIDYDLTRRKSRGLLDSPVEQTPEKMNAVYGSIAARIIGGKPVAFVEGLSFPEHQGVLTLYRVDLDTGHTKFVAIGTPDTSGWLIDSAGQIAARSDYAQLNGRTTIWTQGSSGLVKSLAEVHPLDEPELVGFGRTPDTVLIAADGDEATSYREVKLGTSQLSEPIKALEGNALIVDPLTRTVIGTRDDDALHVAYTFFAPDDEKLWRRVVRGFPGAVVRLESWSADRHKIVLRVEGTTHGAAYYLLDTATRHAAWLANEYADIDADDIAEQIAIEYPAADGTKIPAFLTLPRGRLVKDTAVKDLAVKDAAAKGAAAKRLPLVVLAHGGPAGSDEAGFNWWSQALASRGYAVLQPQFRGSKGFGEKLHAAGYGEWGRKMQTDLSDGVAYLAKAGTIDPARVCIVGASYGGYAALAGVTLQTGIYRCAVSLAGPSDLRAMLASEEEKTGGRKNATLRYWQRFMGAKSPSDPALDAISPARLAARATVPVLLIHGVDDTVVPFAQSTAMASAMKKAGHPAQLVTLKGEDHWLSRSETRTAMLTATAGFLATNLPVEGAAAGK